MLKPKRFMRKVWLFGLTFSVLILIASQAFGKTIDIKGIGAVPLIGLIICIIIVLLQLIPAGILFFSFIGTTSSMVFKKKKIAGESDSIEKVGISGYEPAPVKK